RPLRHKSHIGALQMALRASDRCRSPRCGDQTQLECPRSRTTRSGAENRAQGTTVNQFNHTGSTLVNHWQRGVPVYGEPVITRTFLFFAALAAVGPVLALVRFCSPLGPLSGMNDAYAWGIWKTFNVMTLTALGFDVGRAWNFWNVVFPWRWNSGSAMLEVAVCMPVYCGIFLAFENLPLVLERFYYKGSEATKQSLR